MLSETNAPTPIPPSFDEVSLGSRLESLHVSEARTRKTREAKISPSILCFQSDNLNNRETVEE